jgi:hypothetical protein
LQLEKQRKTLQQAVPLDTTVLTVLSNLSLLTAVLVMNLAVLTFLIGRAPRGALRTKRLLGTIDELNKILHSRQDRAAYRRDLADRNKSPALCYNDLLIANKMDFIKDKIDIQRAPNAIEREKGVDVTPLMAEKLMLHNLPVF